ncbi:MAG TPA: hypothetical protein VN688_26210 [Gemmataceae bacterium]|nr:hypothetical protein [Gemmataceae bacterium]
MRSGLHFIGTIGLGLMAASATWAADAPPLRLTDPGLSLQEIRPLDRHVWVLSLDGAWAQPAIPGVAYHVNLLFPNGRSYSHRVLDDGLFHTGEVRCLIPDYQLVRNGLARGGVFTIVVSARRTVMLATAPEVVSNRFEVRWPLARPVLRWPPRTRFTPPVPIDAFPLPGQMIPTPKPSKGNAPPKEQLPVP